MKNPITLFSFYFACFLWLPDGARGQEGEASWTDDLPEIRVHPACRERSSGSASIDASYLALRDYAYTWKRGRDTVAVTDRLDSAAAGAYRLVVSAPSGADTVLYFRIPAEDYRLSISISDTLICLGDTIKVENTSDRQFTGFLWRSGDGGRSDLAAPDLLYRNSGVFRLEVLATGKVCNDTFLQTIVVDRPTDVRFDVQPRLSCPGDVVNFYPDSDSTIRVMHWSFGEQSRTERYLQRSYQHAFKEEGSYPITLRTSFRACPDTSFTDSIRVVPLPEVDLGPDRSICLDGAPILLKNLRSNAGLDYSCRWSTGDTSEVLNVTHPGTYALNVTSALSGCTSTESVRINKDCYLDIPNAFTPNGDGNNDYFLPRRLLSGELQRFSMQVFNRWGRLLFETDDLDGRGWDGRFKGKDQPTGAYVFRIEAQPLSGAVEVYEGSLTLIR